MTVEEKAKEYSSCCLKTTQTKLKSKNVRSYGVSKMPYNVPQPYFSAGLIALNQLKSTKL